MTKFQEKAQILDRQELAAGVFRLTLHAPLIAGSAHPGQFVMVRVGELFDPLLRRPFSIHQVAAGGDLQLLFKVVGRGTGCLARMEPGREVDLLGPLGRGFRLQREDPVCLVGGGMGIAPLYFLGKRLLQHARLPEFDPVLLGAASQQELALLADDFFGLGYDVRTATDDGSLGHHGFVTDLLDAVLPRVSKVYVCGPYPMMRIAAAKCLAAGVACEVSLETHMACGLGACLGCTVQAQEGYAHVCIQGPVFEATEVAWQ